VRTTKIGDLTVSAQGLGCMGMSEWYGATDWDESVVTIQTALDQGVTFLDTADVYGAGHNEVLVGRAIASGALFEGKAWRELVERGARGGAVHFLGLLSDGADGFTIDHVRGVG